jgi:hypothetical protein
MTRQVIVEISQTMSGYVVVEAEDDQTDAEVAKDAHLWIECGDLEATWEDGSIQLVNAFTMGSMCLDARSHAIAWCDVHDDPMRKDASGRCYRQAQLPGGVGI